MAKKYKTPGVYIEEINTFPGSIAQVESSIPAFIGYTEKASRDGKSLLNQPIKISSLLEYIELFGGAFPAKFDILSNPTVPAKGSIKISEIDYSIDYSENNISLMYPSMEFFYANGGRDCYIVSVGTYQGKTSLPLDMEELLGTKVVDNTIIEGGLKVLENEEEPTILVIPDAVNLPTSECYTIYKAALQQCATMQSRFAILDIPNGFQENLGGGEDVSIISFRNEIGIENLSYGAAYYPWLHTNITQKGDLSLENINLELSVLAELLLEETAKNLINAYINDTDKNELKFQNLHAALLVTSPTYFQIIEEICKVLNLLPPSPAMAGIYTMVDTSRGVWKAPANVSVNSVTNPVIAISHEDQESLNIDAVAGKSVNAIRTFPGKGTLVWGARTLDGNSADWKYINVRRTVIMMEQSIKLSLLAFVFESNDANTWREVKNMVSNYLTNLWKEGALAGTRAEDAFAVQIGLGETMTSQDILEGRLLLSVLFAPIRPAEFIVITFEQSIQVPQ